MSKREELLMADNCEDVLFTSSAYGLCDQLIRDLEEQVLGMACQNAQIRSEDNGQEALVNIHDIRQAFYSVLESVINENLEGLL